MKNLKGRTGRGILFFLVGYSIYITVYHISDNSNRFNYSAIAHRGGAELAPENTIAAIENAISLGVPYIEIDIRRSSDRKLVLIHDSDVNRTTNGIGKIAELTLNELKSLDAGSKFSLEFKEERIPTLNETLDVVQTSQSKLVIEVKSPDSYPGIEEDLIQLLHQKAIQEQVIVISFDHEFVSKLKRDQPDLKVGLLYFSYPAFPNQSVEYVAVHWLTAFITPWRIGQLKSQGFKIWVWTVNSSWIQDLILSLGVDGIITDRPK